MWGDHGAVPGVIVIEAPLARPGHSRAAHLLRVPKVDRLATGVLTVAWFVSGCWVALLDVLVIG